MCGLIGTAGLLDLKSKDAIADGLVICSLRGAHSTGIVSINRAGNGKWAKTPGSPYEIFQTKAYDQVVQQPTNKKAFIGHCRHATVGGISRETSHPFYHHPRGS